ncbi:PA domain-containing protein [Chelatococcus asaccharovorans]|uniref:PA domain-containing protein n=2 Tax=Chelatococcus asaccharovorans TaxID=28210 RepID=A0A2V3U4E6_9HYPH|nr:PA domain-containing protein [Chelatococcus asaccharovorans]
MKANKMKTGTTALDYSFPTVMQHVDHMRAHFLNRKSGQGVDLAAGKYVVETMNTYGLDAYLQEFETYDSDIGASFVALGGPDGQILDSRPCLHIEPTPEQGLTAELVDVGPGGLSDYEGKDVRGKIVLAEVSYAPATPEKARIAASLGAAGIVLMNWGEDDSRYIPWRALKAVWGNPTPESWNDIPRLFGVSISRADGIMLRRRMKDGPVSLHVRATASRVWRTLSQPLAWLHAPEASTEREQFVVVSGHIDSWNPGVTDNMTGMSVMLEIARLLASKRETLRRSVVFCFWNGHEVAEAAGSTYFVDSHWERINRDAVAYFNIDSVGMKGTSEFHINSCPELAAFSETLSHAVFDDSLPQKVTTLGRVGDQSFFGIGVAAATGRHSYGADIVKAHNGATLGWYNHTEYDTIDVMDPEALEADLDWCSRYVHALATEPVLPQRFTARLSDMRQRFAAILPEANTPPELAPIPAGLADLEHRIHWFDAFLERASSMEDALRQRANRIVLRLSRLLTFPTASASGRYGQDSYGISTLAYPVPLLAELEIFRALDRNSTDGRLLSTKLIRLRHEITDALQAASDLIDDFRFTVEHST